jgi:MOSC domain-containing protein YiiM
MRSPSTDRNRSAEQPQLRTLMTRFPAPGRLVWIGLRPNKRATVLAVEAAEARVGVGLVEDHYAARGSGKREITLIQAEHLAVIGALLGEPPIEPGRLRRNLVVAGINLLALKDQRFRVGDVLLEGAGLAHPCSRMEEELGEGGYNVMRGHGGITARVLDGGQLRVGSAVVRLPGDAPPS